MKEFVNRVLKPVMLPLTAGVFIAVLVFSFSRILLAVPEMGSTTLAILIAAEILGLGAVIAATTRIQGAQKAVLLVLSLMLIAGGGAAAAIGERPIGEHGEEVAFTIVAKNTAFDLKEIQAPAGEEFAFAFDNQDVSVPHNVAIYPSEDKTAASDALFAGEIFPGVAARTYHAPALEPGTYFFRCDVHPAMNGPLTAGDGSGGGPATNVEVSAKGLAFSVSELLLAADTPVTIEFDNQDVAIPHNLSIYPDAEHTAETDAIFREEPFSGPKKDTYDIPPTPAGEYYFVCDVHQNMNGTATFE